MACRCAQSEAWTENVRRLALRIATDVRAISEANGHCPEARALFSELITQALTKTMVGDAVVVAVPPGERLH